MEHRLKEIVIGATGTVKESKIAKRSLTRVGQALQGTTPGVVVSSTGSQPGTPLSVRIRDSYRWFVEEIFS